MSLSRKRGEQDSVYESFSDLLLGVTVLLIALVAVLAMNVSIKSDKSIRTQIYQNRFTGGVDRPELYISSYKFSYAGASTIEAKEKRVYYNSAPLIMTVLESPSLARTQTTLDKDGNTIAEDSNSSFAGITGLELVDFLEVSAGIEPGEFMVDEKKYHLLKVFSGKKRILLSRIDQELESDSELTAKILKTSWSVFENFDSNIRSYNEYKESNLYIFIESYIDTSGIRWLCIGDSFFKIPDKIKSGELDFIVGLSSANTQIIYLGEYDRTQIETNKRITFFKENGFEEAAKDYELYHYKLWQAKHKDIFSRLSGVDKNEQSKALVRRAVVNMQLAADLLDKGEVSADNLPPLLKHRDAWSAYTEYHAQLQENGPPKWIVEEFLTPLGFNKRIPREEKVVTDEKK